MYVCKMLYKNIFHSAYFSHLHKTGRILIQWYVIITYIILEVPMNLSGGTLKILHF